MRKRKQIRPPAGGFLVEHWWLSFRFDPESNTEGVQTQEIVIERDWTMTGIALLPGASGLFPEIAVRLSIDPKELFRCHSGFGAGRSLAEGIPVLPEFLVSKGSRIAAEITGAVEEPFELRLIGVRQAR